MFLKKIIQISNICFKKNNLTKIILNKNNIKKFHKTNKIYSSGSFDYLEVKKF
jgi:hypothetical protein